MEFPELIFGLLNWRHLKFQGNIHQGRYIGNLLQPLLNFHIPCKLIHDDLHGMSSKVFYVLWLINFYSLLVKFPHSWSNRTNISFYTVSRLLFSPWLYFNFKMRLTVNYVIISTIYWSNNKFSMKYE